VNTNKSIILLLQNK